MAATATFAGDDWSQFGNVPVRFATLTLDASYPAGGYVLTGQTFGGAPTGGFTTANNGIRGLEVIGNNTAGAPYVYNYNAQTGFLQVFWTGAAVSSALAEVLATTNLSTTVLQVLVYLAGE